MKKILVALALAAFATTASAAIANGPHDLTQAPYNGTKGNCQYCHAPHLWSTSNVGAGSAAPLWNRNHSLTGITNYGTTVLGTVVGNPGARSRTCLSCHDGVANLGAVNNGTTETLAAIPAGVNVGQDMTNDHPVGIALPINAEYRTAAAVGQATATAPGLAGTTVECASCHEPHNNNTSFLRTTGTAICSACHIK